jgi:flagellum-specific peptidoglycan hydrolase FlgJ
MEKLSKEEFVKKIYQAAKEGEISPVFVTAQAALESGWGSKAIGNNLFGITVGTSWNGKRRLVRTKEYFRTPNKKFSSGEKIVSVSERLSNGTYRYDCYRYFRDYDNLSECLNDHNRILRGAQFADAWQYRKYPIMYLKHIQDNVGLKYATSPTYVKVMTSLIGTVEDITARLGL